MKPMLFSNLKLHLTTTRSSIFSGFKLVLLRVTILPAKEKKTRSDLDIRSWHWEDHLDELGKKGKLGLVMLPPFQLVHGGQLVRQLSFTPSL